MVQILPPKTDIGTLLGQSLGSGLSQGLQQGGQIGFQRGQLQNALKGLENLPKDSTPFQLASQLMQATAGIPGSERYVGQLFPLLLGQLRSQQAFGEQGAFGPGQQEGQSSPYGTTAQSLTPGAKGEIGGPPGGILGSIIPQDQINRQAEQYAASTGTGLEGATQMQSYLKGKNDIALQQRQMAEQKAAGLGVTEDKIPAFMQLGQKHQNAKTLDDWARATQRDFKEYENASKALEKTTTPGFWRGFLLGGPVRESRLQELDKTVKRLVDLGFEQEVRQKLAAEQLSPTEIEERIHPFSDSTRKALNSLPAQGGYVQSEKSMESKEKSLKDFLKNNITPDTSLLALRQRLWQEKGYDWQRIARAMGEAVDPSKLTAAQQNELATVETEPPRQSLQYIFRDWGNFLSTLKGEK